MTESVERSWFFCFFGLCLVVENAGSSSLCTVTPERSADDSRRAPPSPPETINHLQPRLKKLHWWRWWRGDAVNVDVRKLPRPTALTPPDLANQRRRSPSHVNVCVRVTTANASIFCRSQCESSVCQQLVKITEERTAFFGFYSVCVLFLFPCHFLVFSLYFHVFIFSVNWFFIFL